MLSRGEFGLDELKALHREAVDLAEELSALQGADDDRFIGGDPDGTVEIVVDGAGVACQVRLDPNWRSVVGPAGLGPAVMTAMQEASTARLAGLVESQDREPGTVRNRRSSEGASGIAGATASAEDVAVAAVARRPGNPSAPESMRDLQDLLRLLDAVDGQLTQLNAALEEQATRAITGSNQSQTVQVTLVGGGVTAVEFDQRWLSAAYHDRIAAAVFDALRSAQQRAAAAAQGAVDHCPAIGEITALAGQPELLLQKLGFLTPESDAMGRTGG